MSDQIHTPASSNPVRLVRPAIPFGTADRVRGVGMHGVAAPVIKKMPHRRASSGQQIHNLMAQVSCHRARQRRGRS